MLTYSYHSCLDLNYYSSLFIDVFFQDSQKMSKRAVVFLADGAEEMETVITVDVLRRGGIEVILAGVKGDSTVVCSRNVKIVPDISIDKFENEVFDALIIPGGLKGAEACGTVSYRH